MKRIIFSIILLISIQELNSQIKFNPGMIEDGLKSFSNQSLNGTARYIGMSGAMGALGGDLSIVGDNPAAVAVFNNSLIEGTLALNSNSNKAKMLYSHSSKDTYFDFSNIGGVISFPTNNLTVNIGVNFENERLDNEVIFGNNPSFYYGDANEYQFNSFRQYTKGYKSKIGGTLGLDVKNLYFGLGLNGHYLSMDRYFEYSDLNTTTGIVEYFDAAGTPYSRDNYGFSLGIGAIAKITNDFRVGASYTSPIWWTEDDIWINYVPYAVESYDVDFRYTAPGKIMGSVAYILSLPSTSNDHSLAADFDFINYFNGDLKFKPDHIDDIHSNNLFVDNYIKNNQEYRVGLEYRNKFLRIRGGYAFINSPMKNDAIMGYYDAIHDYRNSKDYLIGETNKFSLGVGLDFNTFFIDFAWQNISSEYYTSFSGKFGEMTFEDITLGKVKNNRNNFLLSLGWRFN